MTHTAAQLKEYKEEMREAYQQVYGSQKELVYAGKADLSDAYSDAIDKADKLINQLEEKMENAQDNAKASWQDGIDWMTAQRKQLQEDKNALVDAADDKVSDYRDKLSNLLQETANWISSDSSK